MTLTLNIINQQALAADQELSKTFEGSGTIGRAPGQDWVLHDESRYISSSHAHIHDEDGHFYITDASTNGVFVNGADQPLGRGNSVLLNDGDCLQIGGYEIAVAINEAVLDASAAPVDDASASLSGGLDEVSAVDSAAPQSSSSLVDKSEVPFLFNGGNVDCGVPSSNTLPEDCFSGDEHQELITPASCAGVADEALPSLDEPGSVPPPRSSPQVGMFERLEMKTGMDTSTTLPPLDLSPVTAPSETVVSESIVDPTVLRASLRGAVLEAVTKRFDPLLLQTHFDQQSQGGGFLAIQKRARNWEMYETYFKALSEQLADDFQHLFGEAFAEAYEAQAQRTKQQ